MLTAYAYFLAILFTATLLVASISPLKASLDWVDLWGEAIAFAGSTCWLHLVISSRPLGRVTHWLGVGVGCLATGFYLDMLDEIFSFTSLPGGSLENVAVPLGVLLLSYAYFLYREEQLAIRDRSYRRELEYRDHTKIDQITRLYGIRYLINELEQRKFGTASTIQLGVKIEESTRPIELDQFVRKRAADQLIAMVPDDALVAHYAGDRFTILLPAEFRGASTIASTVAATLQHTLENTLRINGFNPMRIKCETAVGTWNNGESARAKLRELNTLLSEQFDER